MESERDTGRTAGRQRERDEEGKHYMSMPSKHGMLGYFNKKPPFIQQRKGDLEREKERKTRGKKKAGKWKVKATAYAKHLLCKSMRTVQKILPNLQRVQPGRFWSTSFMHVGSSSYSAFHL